MRLFTCDTGVLSSSWKHLNYSDTYGSTPCSLVPPQSAAQPRKLTESLLAAAAAAAAIYTPRLMKHTQFNLTVFSQGFNDAIHPNMSENISHFSKCMRISVGCCVRALD